MSTLRDIINQKNILNTVKTKYTYNDEIIIHIPKYEQSWDKEFSIFHLNKPVTARTSEIVFTISEILNETGAARGPE